CFGMDEAEENKYVSQLKEVFDSCDTTGTGYLDKEELTELCHKLHLEAQLPVLLQILLGTDHYARVNFEEFKEGFVAVLSSTIEFSTSDEDSSYLEPAIPDEVKPKYIKGTKRYGRRTHPEVQDSEVETTGDLGEQLIHGTKKCQLKRSASLESVESLKSDEETESNKEIFEAQAFYASCCVWGRFIYGEPNKGDNIPLHCLVVQMKLWRVLTQNPFKYSLTRMLFINLSGHLTTLDAQELDDLFINLDKDKDGRISLKEFQHGLFIHFPLSLPTSSTPFKQRRLGCLQQAFEEIQCRTASPSLLSNALGTHLFSSIDDGTGYVNAEQIVNIWKEEGIENSRKILETLDFTVEEKLNLAELTMALDNELMVSKNGIHQAVLASYKNEIHYLQVQVESTCKEKDKVKADLKKAEKCNLQLAKEVDERHAAIEHLNENKIKGLEQEYKEKTTAVLSEMDKERELIMQQVNTQRAKLETEIDSLRTEESHLREKLSLVMKENCRLQKELVEVVEKLSESEGLVSKLQKDLNYMLKEKLSMVDPQNTELFNQEERFAEIIKEYVLLIRELRDQNDELQSELETQDLERRVRQERAEMEQYYAKEISELGQRLAEEKDRLEAELQEKHQQDLQLLRKETEAELRKRLAQMESQYTENQKVLMKQHQCEQKETEQRCSLELQKLKEQYSQEKLLWEAKEQEIMDLRKEKLKFKEKMNEEQAQICNTFAVEKEAMENQYREQIHILSCETECLKAQLMDKQKQQLEEKSNLCQQISVQLDAKQQQLILVRSQLEAQKEKLLLFKKKEEGLINQIQQANNMMQQQEARHEVDLKAKDELLQKQKAVLVEQAVYHQVSGKVTAKEKELSLRQKEQDLPFQFQHSVCAACKQKTEYESNLRQREELVEKKIKLFEEQMSSQQTQLCAKEEEILIMKRKEQAMLCQLQQQEAEADVRVQQIKEEVKKEKNQLKENLLELEDLVHTLENETDAGRKCRNELNGLYEENCSLKGKVGRFQEEIHNLETEVEKQRKQLEALKWDKEKAQHEMGSLNEQNKNYKDEMHLLNTRNLQLSGEISNLSAKLETCQNTIQLLHKRLEEVTHQKQEAALVTKQLQEASTKLEKEQIQEQSLWQREKEMMDQELKISRNKLLEAITKLNVAQSQHVREVQQLREQVGFAVSKDQLNHVQLKLAEEQQKADQADKQMAAQQEEHEKVLKKMGERMEEVEMKLKNVRIILQEKVNQLKDQLAKNTKSDMMLKDLYVENSQLMKALQVTEQRQKSAEKKNFQMEEKIVALNKLLRKIAPASLTA
uniref:Ninein like n=1 Tax=Latimeria chalumnae TaxID=7897 RepID=H3A0K9_LATCH